MVASADRFGQYHRRTVAQRRGRCDAGLDCALVDLALHFGRTTNASTIYWVPKISSYIAGTISIYAIGRIWFQEFGEFLTFLGLIAAGLAIALRDPVTNLFGWLFIVARRPYELGHRIQIGETIGDVVDLRLFQTSLLEIGNWVDADQPTGRIVHVPNGKVFTEMQFNYSLGVPFIWDELPVLVTFESDWEEAKNLLTAIVNERILTEDRPSTADLLSMSRMFRAGSMQLDPESLAKLRTAAFSFPFAIRCGRMIVAGSLNGCGRRFCGSLPSIQKSTLLTRRLATTTTGLKAP